MAVDATNWYNSTWATEQGLYNQEFETTEQLDQAVSDLANQLAKSSPEAMQELKMILWKGMDNWDELLEQRAEVSGRLVLSEYTKTFIQKFKSKS
jgi:methylglutaconyl-CoA hydratase